MKRRLTLRDETGKAILNCYACKTEGRMICDYFSCQQRLIDRLADFEDADNGGDIDGCCDGEQLCGLPR